jgi:hypothetical protein
MGSQWLIIPDSFSSHQEVVEWATQAEQRAARLAAMLPEMGIDPEALESDETAG